MVRIHMDGDDFDDAAEEMEKWAKRLQANVDAVMNWLEKEILRNLQDITPKKTGKTAASWTVISEGDTSFFITNSNSPVIDYLTLGTAGHGPVSAPFLTWINDQGQRIFAKWVRGIVAEDYEDEVMDAVDPVISEMMDAALDAADVGMS